MGFYGAVVPLVAYRRRWTSRWPVPIRTLVPHPVLVPAFAVLFVWRLSRVLIVPPESLRFAALRYSEVAELVLAIAIALTFVWQLRTFDRIRSAPPLDG